MAEWYTEEHRLALIRRYGLPKPGDNNATPEEKAIKEARALDPEIDELCAMRDSFGLDEFARLLWPRVLRVLGITEDTSAGEPEAPSSPPIVEPDLRADRSRPCPPCARSSSLHPPM